MTLGPIQLVVLGFTGDEATEAMFAELRAVREKNIIRLLSLLFVHKAANGALTQIQISDLNVIETQQLGILAGSLIGLSDCGSADAAEVDECSLLASEHDFGLGDDDIRDITKDIPPDSGAAIVLFEHHWAVNLKERIGAAGGFVLAQGMVQPTSLLPFGADLASSERMSTQNDARASP